MVRENYRLGVPEAAYYQVILNSDSAYYGGSNVGAAGCQSEPLPWMGHRHSIQLLLPPLAALVLKQA